MLSAPSPFDKGPPGPEQAWHFLRVRLLGNFHALPGDRRLRLRLGSKRTYLVESNIIRSYLHRSFLPLVQG